MKRNTNRDMMGHAIAIFVLVSLGVSACYDGKLDTVVEAESLEAYMESRPSLRLFMNGVHNLRKPVFACFYEDNHRLNKKPIGKYDSEKGIPYGQFTAVEIPEPENANLVKVIYTTDGISDCVDTLPDVRDLDAPPYVLYDSFSYNEDDSADFEITMFEGYLSMNSGGEDWGDICGENGDDACEDHAEFRFMGGALTINMPQEGRTALDFFNPMDIGGQAPELTLCWDPDDAGAEPAILLTEYPVEYDETLNTWSDFPPITTGTLHLQAGHVACETADMSAALATLSIPAEMTFGPADGKLTFDADSSGQIFIIGTGLNGVPAEAGYRIVPLLNP